VFTRGYHSHMRPGSHHFIMFGMNPGSASPVGPMTNGGGAESAVGALGGTFLGGATRAVQNIDTQGEYPEDRGIGSEMPAHRPIAVNLHFINIGDHPLLQEIWINFILIPEAEVTQYVKPITWYGGFGMAIPPGAHEMLSNAGTACTAPDDVRVAMMTGHVHANTLRITTTMTPSGATDPTLLFTEYDWHEPAEWRFNRSANNPAPDDAAKKGGAYDGIVNAKSGDQFNWECEILNKSNTTLTFSNRVYDGEMCNVFGFYFTEKRDASPWTCAFL
jgi:hypothetical protein